MVGQLADEHGHAAFALAHVVDPGLLPYVLHVPPQRMPALPIHRMLRHLIRPRQLLEMEPQRIFAITIITTTTIITTMNVSILVWAFSYHGGVVVPRHSRARRASSSTAPGPPSAGEEEEEEEGGPRRRGGVTEGCRRVLGGVSWEKSEGEEKEEEDVVGEGDALPTDGTFLSMLSVLSK